MVDGFLENTGMYKTILNTTKLSDRVLTRGLLPTGCGKSAFSLPKNNLHSRDYVASIPIRLNIFSACICLCCRK